MGLDIIIKNGRLIDGSGNPWRYADIGISGDRIACVAAPGALDANTQHESSTQIDATAMVVAPGFVDVHNHADFSCLDDPLSPYFVFQGVTTLIAGNCGHSVTGAGADQVRDYWYRQGLISKRQACDTRSWDTLAGYRRLVQGSGGLAFWSGILLGHGTIRMAVVGPQNRPASPDEMAKMKELVRQGMEDGAVGLSTGLDYQPGRFAPTAEIVELAKVVAEYGGVYATHTRGTPDRKDMISAIEEAIHIGEMAGARVQISHVSKKALKGRELRLIEEARSRGVDVACDATPYSTFFALSQAHLLLSARAGSAELFMKDTDEVKRLLGDKARRRAIVDNDHVFRFMQPRSSMLIHCKDKSLEGKTLAEIAESRGTGPVDCLFDLILDEDNPFTLCPKFEHAGDIAAIPAVQITHPAVLMGSDAGPVDPEDPLGWFSPQGSGSTLRYLVLGERYNVPLEERVRKLTNLACQRFGLFDRGLVEPGKVADLLVFDPNALTEVVDWDDPYAAPVGMRHVLVGGIPVVSDGKQTGRTPGGVLDARKTS